MTMLVSTRPYYRSYYRIPAQLARAPPSERLGS
jgi:hypothetical protein